MYLGGFWDDIQAAVEAEARRWLEQATGAAYDAIPPELRAELERQYIARRLAEERAKLAGRAKGALPALAALAAGGLALLAIPENR